MHTLYVVLPELYTLTPLSVVDILRGSSSGMPVSGLPFLLYVCGNPISGKKVTESKLDSAITPLLIYARALTGRRFNVTERIKLEILTSSITKARTVSSV